MDYLMEFVKNLLTYMVIFIITILQIINNIMYITNYNSKLNIILCELL